jgi:hypothetical protein
MESIKQDRLKSDKKIEEELEMAATMLNAEGYGPEAALASLVKTKDHYGISEIL